MSCFHLLWHCKLLSLNNALAVHNSFSSDGLLLNQFSCPSILLLEGLFFLSIAKLQKCPLSLYHFPFYNLSSLQSNLFKCSFKPPMLGDFSSSITHLRCYSSLQPAITFFLTLQPLLYSWQHFLTFSS